MCCVINVSWSGEALIDRVSYQAADQEVADLLAGLGTFNNERHWSYPRSTFTDQRQFCCLSTGSGIFARLLVGK
jgi:hypothetical protein